LSVDRARYYGSGTEDPLASRPDDFLEALGVAVYVTDAAGIITRFNKAAADLWGRRPVVGEDQWCGSWKLYYADGSPMPHADSPMALSLRENRPVRGNVAIAERPDGTRVWFEAYPTPIRDAGDTLLGAVNVLIDTTERKRAEDAAFHLTAVVTSSDDAIVSKDLSGIVRSWNQAAERLFGFRADEIIGRSIRLIIPSDRQAEEDDVLAKVSRGERVDHFETVRQRKDGSHVPISLTVSPVRDTTGRIIGASKIARDITERREADRAIAEALAVKDEFIGLVSHELRTPLTTILGNAVILARRNATLDEESRASAAEDIQAGAMRLNAIIDDLLSLARLESGHIGHEPILLARVIQHHVKESRRLTGRRIELTVEGDEPIVVGDQAVLGHVIDNDLSNAAKYSPPDSVIEVVIESSGGEGCVRVLDRGIGIDPAESEKLFESFYRSTNVGDVSGVGIGLSVCRRLARAIDGRCWAAPRDGGGSEFGLALPEDEDGLA
jgi:PAS domain S-box-containing protein